MAVETLRDAEFFRRLLRDLTDAREIKISALCIDHGGFCAALLRKLNREAAAVSICVDLNFYNRRTSVSQRPRLLELQAAGAQVYLCGPRRAGGHHHTKAVVFDSHIAYLGGANLTNAAHFNNTELMLRLTGPPVADIESELAGYMSSTTRIGVQ